MRLLFLFTTLLLLASNAKAQENETEMFDDFAREGHRGARGELPENVIVSFERALEAGCNWIELDVVVTRDTQVLVSHEPWMNPKICTLNGQPVPGAPEATNLYHMTLEQAQRYDCGSTRHPDFADQKPQPATKPTLAQVFAELERFRQAKNLPEFYLNVEIKCKEEWDGKFTPPVPEYCKRVMAVIRQAGMEDRVLVQSFDARIVKYFNDHYHSIPLAYLNDVPMGIDAMERKLGFRPEVYSPHHLLVNKEMVKICHAAGIRLVPWTVNEAARMRKLMEMGVDGIISDYPTLLEKEWKAFKPQWRPPVIGGEEEDED